MCGLCGMIKTIQILITLSEKLSHRGPDDRTINTKISENYLCLMHRRLSIIDLSKMVDSRSKTKFWK